MLLLGFRTADGGYTIVSAANPLPVTGGGGGGGGDVNLTQINGQAVSAGAGVTDGGTQRVVLASDQATLPVVLLDASDDPIDLSNPSASNITQVTAAAANTVLLTDGPLRKGFSVFNDSTAIMRLAYGTDAASTSNYTVKLNTNDFWEDPWGYTGAVNAIWEAANGSALVTEVSG